MSKMVPKCVCTSSTRVHVWILASTVLSREETLDREISN